MDLLSNVLKHFSLNANVFFSGKLCGLHGFAKPQQHIGHLHLLRAGRLNISGDNGLALILDKPAVIFFPHATAHRLIADETSGADLVCAEIHYPSVNDSPLTKALPTLVSYPLDDSGLLGQSAIWLFDEAFSQRSGRVPIIDRLCDIFLINVIRKMVEDGNLEAGMLAGLAHPQLSALLNRLHQSPEQHWSVQSMAEYCAMSRSKFSVLFRETLGQSPMDYLTDWRMSLAKSLLLSKPSIDIVANHVGYENGSALARAFRKKTALSPSQWLAQYHAQQAAR